MGAPLYGGGGLVEPLRVAAWLDNTLASDVTLTTDATGGVWRGMADESVPSGSIYVVYSVQASPDAAGVAGWRIKSTSVAQVAAVGPAAETLTVGRVAERIDQLLQRAGPQTYTTPLGQIRIIACVRESALVVDEITDGVQYVKIGGLYRIPASAV